MGKYSTETWQRKDRIAFGWGMFVLGIFLGVALSLIVLLAVDVAAAEEEYDVWVICQKNDYINIRKDPRMDRTEITGRAEAGMRFRTDGKERNGFLHLVGVTEYGEGWIHKGYVVYDEPEKIFREMTIRANGKVRARKRIGGELRRWVKPGDVVMVYWLSDEWAVTSEGFVMAEYLEE